MNKVAVGLINSTATVPLQCCLSPCSAKRVKCKKKKKKKSVKTQTQQSSVLSERALYQCHKRPCLMPCKDLNLLEYMC